MKYFYVLIILYKFYGCFGFCELYAKGYDGNYENIMYADCQEGLEDIWRLCALDNYENFTDADCQEGQEDISCACALEDYENVKDADCQERPPENIYRPCDLDDYSCIRDFFALNSQCSPTFGYTPDPIQLPIMKFYLPASNMTTTDTDIEVRGFGSAKIIEFYLSRTTGNVVLAVAVPKVNLTTEKSFWSYQRPAKEPIAFADYFTIEQDNVLFTVVIPKVPFLRLEYAEIYAHIGSFPSQGYIGPKIYTSDDPTVQAELFAMRANLFTVVKECYIFYSYLLMTIFIQSELCDFGVDPNNYSEYVANGIPGNAAF